MLSFWASVCTVHQTYGRNYQRKVEITSGLGQIYSLEESHCVCRCLRPLASCRQSWDLACLGLLPFAWQQ